jgi:hypothetical protein
MKSVGGSIRSAAYLAVAISTAILILLSARFSPATAADASPADTAAAAALYERATPDSGSSASAKPASASGAAPDSGTAASASPSAASSDPDDPSTEPTAAASAAPPTAPPSSAGAPVSPVTTETVVVPASMPAPTYMKHDAGAPASTTEIPQSAGGQVQSGPEPGTAEIDNNPAPDAQTMNYLAHQNPQTIDPQLRSLQEFINEGDESSPLGVQLREDQRKLNSGEIANGLLIVGVEKHSAAAVAGLHAFTRTTRNVAEGVAVAASMFFPPAVLAVPLLDQMNFGESYDLIIGVDGARVANYLDFEDRMRDLQPGQIVYLSIVRNGNRVQVPVHVLTLSPAVF